MKIRENAWQVGVCYLVDKARPTCMNKIKPGDEIMKYTCSQAAILNSYFMSYLAMQRTHHYRRR